MNARTSPAGTGASPLSGTQAPERALRNWHARAFGALSAAFGTVAGITPHVLHHIAPIAGTALLTGTAGSVLFGAIGFALTVPMLVRLKRRFGSWTAPAIALFLYAAMFTVSALWIGPAIRGENRVEEAQPADPHHSSSLRPAHGDLVPNVILLSNPRAEASHA